MTTLNEKLTNVYEKILYLKDEAVSINPRLESGDLEDDSLKRSMNKLEDQEIAHNRKLELATINSKKHCLNLEVDALAGSSNLRLPTVLRDAHIEAVKKEKRALKEDIRRMRIQKKESLARLHSLNLEADKMNSDEKRNKEKTLEEDSKKADLAALLAETEAAKEKDTFFRKSIEETATVLSRDQNDIIHILEDLTAWRKRGAVALRKTSEAANLILAEDDTKPKIVEDATMESSTTASNALKLKMSQCDKEIEAKMNQLMTAMVSVNSLLEMERHSRQPTEGKEKILDGAELAEGI